MSISALDLLPNPDEAVVVVAAVPTPKAEDAVVLAPNEPNENPDVPSQQQQHRKCFKRWVLWQRTAADIDKQQPIITT